MYCIVTKVTLGYQLQLEDRSLEIRQILYRNRIIRKKGEHVYYSFFLGIKLAGLIALRRRDALQGNFGSYHPI
ncbi:hypothetical protein BDZ91DRAFT_729740 [Kalaharituber pfeilii]|nr:hypothetical protein BDZ91DRAFT_729740 [Kalaharituber pfeilii]